MTPLKFEYKITFYYFLFGGLWILFSDRALAFFVIDQHLQAEIQTYKGWFYVLATSVFLYLLVKNHIKKLRRTELALSKHEHQLEALVEEKTQKLDVAINDLSEKNKTIENQNDELKRTLENLQKTQMQLLQAEKMASLGVLTKGVAHEINNPLNFIKGGIIGLEKLVLKQEVKNSKSTLFVNSIKEGVDRVAAIVSNLSTLTNSKWDREKRVEDVHQVLNNSIDILNLEAKKNIKVIKAYYPQPLLVDAYISQIKEVFIVLLSNALDAIEDNRGEISISTQVDDFNVIIEIADNGRGMSSQEVSRILVPFYTTKAAGRGTGLGLSMAYNIIEYHSGQIIFESEKRKGTRVIVNLPIKK